MQSACWQRKEIRFAVFQYSTTSRKRCNLVQARHIVGNIAEPFSTQPRVVSDAISISGSQATQPLTFQYSTTSRKRCNLDCLAGDFRIYRPFSTQPRVVSDAMTAHSLDYLFHQSSFQYSTTSRKRCNCPRPSG